MVRMPTFVVQPGVEPAWPGITGPGRVVAKFLAFVRVTGDAEQASALMAPVVRAHQQLAEGEQTVDRTPAEYAEHVQDMLCQHGRFTYEVLDVLGQDDRVTSAGGNMVVTSSARVVRAVRGRR